MDAGINPLENRDSPYPEPVPLLIFSQILVTQWATWELIFVDGSSEDRETAYLRLVDCLDRRATTLDLSGLNLTELPENLPPFITNLNVDNNQLMTLPNILPLNLVIISAERNWLKRLPDNLPVNLLELRVSINQLAALPANLPMNLSRLHANNNQLTRLPDTLPDSIHELRVSRNDLDAWPARLPAELRILEATENVLIYPPNTLPQGIKELNLARNMLLRAPTLWPPTLKTLNLSNNRLLVMPENLPETLVDLNISNNPINALTLADPQKFTALRILDISRTSLQRISNTIWNLPAQCNIVLENNLVANRVRHAIGNFIASPVRRGPHFIINPVYYSNPTPPPGLPEAAAYWYSPARRTEIRRAWYPIARNHAELSAEFAQFLCKLVDSIYYLVNPHFRRYMRDRLDRWAHNPVLRQQVMLLALEAATTCEDRITLTLKEIEKAEVAFDIEQGLFDKDLPALIARGRILYRQEKLQNIAINRINSHPQGDAIEIYLAYLVKLNTRLALNSSINRIRFYHLSELRQKDINSAERDVKQQENNAFVPWLLRWSPWERVMSRMDPPGYAQMLARREDALENTFQRRLQGQLDELALGPDAQLADAAAVQLGKKILDDIETECRLPLLRHILGAHQQLALIDPFWPR